jgi:hypothetical protein
VTKQKTGFINASAKDLDGDDDGRNDEHATATPARTQPVKLAATPTQPPKPAAAATGPPEPDGAAAIGPLGPALVDDVSNSSSKRTAFICCECGRHCKKRNEMKQHIFTHFRTQIQVSLRISCSFYTRLFSI